MQRCKKRQTWQIYLCYFLQGSANFLDHAADKRVLTALNQGINSSPQTESSYEYFSLIKWNRIHKQSIKLISNIIATLLSNRCDRILANFHLAKQKCSIMLFISQKYYSICYFSVGVTPLLKYSIMYMGKNASPVWTLKLAYNSQVHVGLASLMTKEINLVAI